MWRDDVLAVNGFDNRYCGHGLEDSDFVVRLIRNGVLRKLGDRSSPVIHLWHERPKGGSSASPNQDLFRDLLHSERRIRAADGLDGVARISN